MELIARLRRTWTELSSARRDLAVIAAVSFIAWLMIEESQACTMIFRWIADHPQYEYDSLLLALIIAAAGTSIFALRRYDEMTLAEAARERAEHDYQQLAFHDPLTGLANRNALNQRLEQVWRDGEMVGLVLLDLDRFKSVNDLHGHAAGDRLLVQATQRIADTLGKGQQAFRLGGDEFAVVVPELANTTLTSENVSRRLIRALRSPFDDYGLVHHIGASAGIAHFPVDGRDPITVMRAADMALYRAKDEGRGRYACFEPAMDDAIRKRARLEREIRQGIPLGEFSPYYQPIVSLKSGEIVGYEILARWQRRDGQEIAPDQFIPIAEECGLINDMTFRLLDRALAEARSWAPHLTLEVNMSPNQLRDPWISERLLALLARNNFPAGRFGIEITEDAILADEGTVRRVIESLKNQGARIVLDDFGTGYSSLHHLRTLPLDQIKIDRSFMRGLQPGSEAFKIVKAMVGLALSLDLPVTAEGVESAEMAALLRELGCTQGQGYFFGRPMPAAIVEDLCAPERPLSARDCTAG